MATYVNVTETEMDAFLGVRGFQRLSIPGTVELTYAKGVKIGNAKYSLRIYSGITNGNSRARGADAIRVCLFVAPACPACKLITTPALTNNNKVWACTCGKVYEFDQLKPRMIGVTKRVNRTYGWRKNLDARLDSFQNMIGPLCPQCRAPMVIRSARNNKNNKFWGCSNFSVGCHGTRAYQATPDVQ